MGGGGGNFAAQLLARLARHEAPIASLPLDFLSALLHQSLRAAVPSAPGYSTAERRHCDVIYMRWSRVGGAHRGANLVRSETVKLFNASGQVSQVRYLAPQYTHTPAYVHSLGHHGPPPPPSQSPPTFVSRRCGTSRAW